MRPRTELTAARRKDRAIDDDAWIAAFLRRAPMGTLAMLRDGAPAANANIFVYDAARHAIYMHTARTGRTPETLAEPAPVCFTAAAMGRLLPAATALEMSVEYESVIVYGDARTVADDDERRRAMELLLDKYFPHLRPGEHYRAMQDEEIARTSVHRIDIREWSGKAKRAAADFAGAFRYPPVEVTPA